MRPSLRCLRRTVTKWDEDSGVIVQLKQVVEKIHAGAQVDVAKALGTGKPHIEQQWAKVMDRIRTSEEFFPKPPPGPENRDDTGFKRRLIKGITKEQVYKAREPRAWQFQPYRNRLKDWEVKKLPRSSLD